VAVGKLSFGVEALVENTQTLIDQLVRSKPPASKGKYLKKVCVCSTMNPAVQVQVE